ncbi:hypothetical protein M433DRAFT_21333 [Acidomyces richmondensis BFW]|nr:MAG: hypothetical protein FE78DRAFT_41957 [Acidomyces sp. 'richmondensis']KYG49485.1 hypothetical protein M433DRAFT_21333 [Acidomyces richmondensis BFW]
MEAGQKRKADTEVANTCDKRTKVVFPDGRYPQTKKQWRVPRRNDHGTTHTRSIQPGDSGIWATCNKGKEGKCIGELRDLFTEYADVLYGEILRQGAVGDEFANNDGDHEADIEEEIQAEVAGLRNPGAEQLFTHVRVDVQCVVFFRTIAPIEPVSFVKRICEDAANHSALKRTRFVKRLSPMTLMGRASAEGLEKVAMEVLASPFHRQPFQAVKFAIRPTIRNHNILTRDGVIKQVASIVGPGHFVDLNHYDFLIVVEVYQNICGVSVLDASFDRLKRFNLAEIYAPTPKDLTSEKPEHEATPGEGMSAMTSAAHSISIDGSSAT